MWAVFLLGAPRPTQPVASRGWAFSSIQAGPRYAFTARPSDSPFGLEAPGGPARGRRVRMAAALSGAPRACMRHVSQFRQKTGGLHSAAEIAPEDLRPHIERRPSSYRIPAQHGWPGRQDEYSRAGGGCHRDWPAEFVSHSSTRSATSCSKRLGASEIRNMLPIAHPRCAARAWWRITTADLGVLLGGGR